MLNIIMPFYRVAQKKYYEDNLVTPDTTWYPILNEGVNLSFVDGVKPILPVRSPGQPSFMPRIRDICYAKIQYFIDKEEIKDDEYYTSLCDDDCYEDGFFDKLKGINSDIFVTSMGIGYERVLLASPQNMKVCQVSHQQLFIKGKIYKTLQFVNSSTADGFMAEYLFANYGHSAYQFDTGQIQYFPNIVVLSNYFRPGLYRK